MGSINALVSSCGTAPPPHTHTSLTGGGGGAMHPRSSSKRAPSSLGPSRIGRFGSRADAADPNSLPRSAKVRMERQQGGTRERSQDADLAKDAAARG